MHAQPLLYGAAPRSAKHGVAAGKTREDAARQCPHLHNHSRPRPPRPAACPRLTRFLCARPSRGTPCGSLAFAWIQS